jgi:ATP-dependent helicase HrpB
MQARTLAIEPLLPTIVAALAPKGANLVIEAPPGAGKTTAVPIALLESPLMEQAGDAREIIVLQPRRLAARLAAHWVATQLGESIGERVGYHVRFDAVSSAATRILFMTQGLLVRRLISDPQLRGVSVVILDEFHERQLDIDLTLALLRALQRGARPDLRIVVMSATLDGQAVASYLDAQVVRSQGRAYPVDIAYQPPPTQEQVRLGREVAFAFRTLLEREGGLDNGHVLAFLPGARAIREAQEACQKIASSNNVDIFVLHGDLSKAEQDAAVGRSSRSKLILSTNVAETSITIDGVRAVIDSGLANVAGFDPSSGYGRLRQEKISQASAIQRAGRAGRTGPGVCIRLYSKNDFDRRVPYDVPEISRADLVGPYLQVAALGLSAPLAWFEEPSPQAWAQAGELLYSIGALASDGSLTEVGREMLRFPIHPRLARMMVAASAAKIGQFGAWICALLSEPALRRGWQARSNLRDHDADVFADFDDLQAARHPDEARRLGLDPQACKNVGRVHQQLRALIRTADANLSVEAREEAMLRAMLLAFPDRVGKVRHEEKEGVAKSVALAGGGQALLDPQSVVRQSPFILAVQAEVVQSGMRRDLTVRSAARIDPNWLIEDWPERIDETDICAYDRQRGRVVVRSELRYQGLLIDSTERPASAAQAGEVLAQALLEEGIDKVCDREELDQLFARTQFLAAHLPDFPILREETVREALVQIASKCTKLAEVRAFDLLAQIKASLGDRAALLDRLAPSQIKLQNGRRVRLVYEGDRPPGLSSRLQDFFGLRDGPRVLDGKVAIRLHLLAPNHRDVQVTTDLAGFWSKHYPEVRRALMRRYPRHAWPENPLQAEPPPPRR